MTFVTKTWQNAPSTATPISAAAIIDLETRLSGYTDTSISTLATYTFSTGLVNTSNTITVSYGTTSGTAAQGNDSRFTKIIRTVHTWAVTGAIAVSRSEERRVGK